MAFTELIAAKTAAEDSSTLTITGPTTITADGLGIGEVLTVEIGTVAEGWKKLTINNAPITLTEGNNTILIISPGLYRIVKPVTVAAVAVGYSA
jgi:hypothetical protein